MQLTEKYRPKTFAEVAGQPKAVAVCQSVIARGLGGRAILIEGKSGCGKTTLANLLAAELAEGFGIVEQDAGRITAERLREMESEMQYRSFGEKSGRVFIINEVHALKKPIVNLMLTMLERIPRHACMIFTTTLEASETLFEDSVDAAPWLSRCLRIKLAQRDITGPMAERALSIAKLEQLDGGAELPKLVKMLQTHRNNLRAVLQEIEAGALLA